MRATLRQIPGCGRRSGWRSTRTSSTTAPTRGRSHVTNSLISPDSAFGSDSIEAVEPDPDRASQLVEEARADGVEPTIEILTNTNPPAPDVALAWQGMLEAVGFEVTT